jgi:uncharacterized protein YijF (DUF1287 family)
MPLMVFFARKEEALPVTHRADHYARATSGRYIIVHNARQSPKMEDVLFAWKITGHYRYLGPVLGKS